MGKGSITIRKHKDLVASGELELTPRKLALLHATSIPDEMSGSMLSAARAGAGASLRLVAESAGLTQSELQYILDLAEMGHPAYREFRDNFLRARSEPAIGVIRGLIDDATDLERRNTVNQKMALDVTAPGLLESAQLAKNRGEAVQTQHFVVNISDKFEAVPAAVDAEYEEVS
jgi:hypothetical protein